MKRAVAVALFAFIGSVTALAQFQMPDPKQMSGIPRPVDDLPSGSISVRLIRGSLSNNISGHPVDLHVGGKTQTVKTDENGRAQFDKVPAGVSVKATADVDGEHLESQEFPAPSQGGIRLMLVATDKNAAPATSPSAPAESGQVVLTNQSRIVMEPGDEAVNVFYLLDIENTARVPVNPPTPFVFDLPKEAQGAGIMEGSTPQAALTNGRVTIAAPFAPGHTFVQVGMSIPTSDGSVSIAQSFPAALSGVAIIAQKLGDATLSSPQVQNQREMPADGRTFIAATGGAVNAGQPITLTLSGLPHHSRLPLAIALLLAVVIVGVGFVKSRQPGPGEAARLAERKRQMARRDRLLADLVRLDADRRLNRGAAADEHRYTTRRAELLAALEPLYAALDHDEPGPEPGGRADVAA
ncbi:MAG TPA: hypothetical protein VH583_04070 [Vicinamibacterales bacterium]